MSTPIIRDLNISQEILTKVEEVMASNKFSAYYKKKAFKEITGVSPCCLCGAIPSIEIRTNVGDMTRVERFCKVCYQLSLERDKDLPQNREDLALHFGCSVAPIGMFGKGKKGHE